MVQCVQACVLKLGGFIGCKLKILEDSKILKNRF